VKKPSRVLSIIAALALTSALGVAGVHGDSRDSRERDRDREREARGVPKWKVNLIESCTIADVPAGAFIPDRAFIPGSTSPDHNQVFFQLPVNYGVIRNGREIVLYDTGIQPSTERPPHVDLVKLIGCVHWVPIRQQLLQLGISPEEVTKIVVGHGHWDHAGQLDQFPHAVLFIQEEELRGIEDGLNLPAPLNRVNTDPPGSWPGGPLPAGCARTPACGYPPATVAQIFEKVASDMAEIVDGREQIAPGLIIHPAFRSHTAGSQLLQVNTSIGQVLFGSDTYSSWTGIKRLLAANIQQTDTVQQFLAYAKCINITGNGDTCVSAHEPLSYTSGYPLTQTPCPGVTGFRCAVIAE